MTSSVNLDATLFQKVLPIGFSKLPLNIQMFIIIAVGLHVFALITMVLFHFTSKKTPDFKGKIKW